MNYRKLYETGKDRLEKAGIQEAALDARLLLEEVCRTDRNTLLVHGDRAVTEEEETQFRIFIERRSTHEPLQQITGWQEFMGLRFSVTEDVLVPRQDTETLVEEVMRYLRDGMEILDVCTGSGCILLSLLRYSNGCRGVGCDISEKALAVAGQNAKELGISAQFIQSDLFESIEGRFEYIVSNPPYIRKDMILTLMEEVRDHEPLIALDGGEDGLDFYRKITREATEHLYSGGMLFFEIGYDQGEAVKLLMEEEGYEEVTVSQDLAGLDRVVYGTFNGRK
ncbi:peptide chain release factor N(5)-glutamine methyltransferase [Suilimivivens sp.]|uniref:peptide chain release factor N(5)-glutamine methyltransferase n=1 Tax=Suilimivivens sp. TaxID=2981669 RepID=UPI0030768BA0